MVNKYSHYQYRTYDNFDRAVNAGEASWEAIDEAYQKSKKLMVKKTDTARSAGLDAWGFPQMSPKQLLHSSGSATLSECRRAVKEERLNFSTASALMKRLTARNPGLLENLKPRQSKVTSDQVTPPLSENMAPPPTISSKKPTGRPRKYNKAHLSRSNGPGEPCNPRYNKQAASFRAQTRKQAEDIARRELDRSRQRDMVAIESNWEEPSVDDIIALPAPLIPQDAARQSSTLPLISNPGGLFRDTDQQNNMADDIPNHSPPDDYDPTVFSPDNYVTKEMGPPRKKMRRSYNPIASMSQEVMSTNVASDNNLCDGTPQRGNSIASSADLQADVATRFLESIDNYISAEQRGKKRTLAPDKAEIRPFKKAKFDAADDESRNPELERRINEIHVQLMNKLIPGLYINPPGSERRKHGSGRPPKQMTVVFKLGHLHNLDWFKSSEEELYDNGYLPEEIDPPSHIVQHVINPVVSPPGTGVHHPAPVHHERGRVSMSKPAREPVRSSSNITQLRPANIPHTISFTAVNKACTAEQIPDAVCKHNSPHEALRRALKTPGPLYKSQIHGLSVTRDYCVSSLSTGISRPPTFSSFLKEFNKARTVQKTLPVEPNLSATNTTLQNSNTIQSVDLSSETRPPLLRKAEQIPSTSIHGEADSITKDYATANSDNTNNNDLYSLQNGFAAINRKRARAPHDYTISPRRETPYIMQPASIDVTAIATDVNSHITPKKKKSAQWRNKTGVKLGAGVIGHKKTQLIIRFITEAGGAYPGDKEIWYAFVTALRREQPNAKPDPSTITRAVKDSVDSGKIRKITFAFKNKSGVASTKHILTLLGVAPDSNQVKALQMKMIEKHPHFYFPPEVEIDRALRMHGEGDYIPAITARRTEFPLDPTTYVGRQRSTGLMKVCRKSAWREWAVTNTAADEQMLKEHKNMLKTPPAVPSEDEEADKYDNNVSEEQAAMQSMFMLGSYAHNPELAPPRTKKKERLHRLMPWRKQEKPAQSNTGRISQAQASRTLAANALPQPRDWTLDNLAARQYDVLWQQGARLSTTQAMRQKTHRPWYPPLNPSGWITGLFATSRPQSAVKQPFSMVFSFSDEQQRRALNARAQKPYYDLAGSLNVNHGNGRLWPKTENFYTKLTDPGQILHRPTGTFSTDFTRFVAKPGYAFYTTLTDPDQNLHTSTGTFSTDFSVKRKVRLPRPRLSIRPELQHEFESRLPRSLEDLIMRQQQPGCGELIDRNISRFDYEVQQVRTWEEANRNDMMSTMQLIQPRFINHTIEPDVAAQVPWFKEEYKPSGRQPRPGAVPRLRKLVFNPYFTTGSRTYKSPYSTVEKTAGMTRETAAFNPTAVSPKSKLRESDQGRPKAKRFRLPRMVTTLSEAQNRRFLVVVTTVRTLLGGLDRHVDWGRVQKLFREDLEATFLRKLWASLYRQYRLQINKLQKDFETSFLRAYADADIPPFNFEQPDEYDWEWLISWTESNLDVPTRELVPELPADRRSFDDGFEIEDDADPYELPMDDLYGIYISGVKRAEILTESSFSIPIEAAKRPSLENTSSTTGNSSAAKSDQQVELAKTYIRANVLTPKANYNATAARSKLLPLGEATLNRALAQLLGSKALTKENKGRLIPGRNYSMSEKFAKSFKSALDINTMFHAAVKYKARLDRAFASPGFLDFSYHANDGDMLAFLNLLAAGRIDVKLVIPPITSEPSFARPRPDEPRTLSTWGFTHGNYRTMQMDRENLIFPMRVTPTETYVDGVALDRASLEPPRPHLLPGSREMRIPIWYDIHDILLPKMWDSVLASVLTAIALRAGTTAKGVMRMCKGGLLEWETECVLKWLADDLGVVRRVGGASNNPGWIAAEWWWAVLGSGDAEQMEDSVVSGDVAVVPVGGDVECSTTTTQTTEPAEGSIDE